ncbi:Thyroid adenoma-associated [Araneus ventricosus]|nr:Thyroid adenoma-associated [Araneus ventricosus]
MDIKSARDAVQQINILKQVQNKLILKDSAELKSHPDLDVLCFMFYQSPLNSYHKKTLSQILKILSQVHPEAVKNSLLGSLELFLTSSLQTISAKGIEKCTDCLLGLLDNFPLGTSIIERNYSVVWKHISDILQYIVSKLNEPGVADLFGACLLVLKAYFLIIQNCIEIKRLLAYNDDKNFESCCNNIVKALEILLLHNNTTLNCRYNAGIAWCGTSFIIDPKMFKDNIFCASENTSFQLEKYPISSQLCIHAGTMTVLPTEEFASAFSDDIIAKIILKKILHISEKVEDAELLLLCTRDLNQWCSKICEVLRIADSDSQFAERISELKNMFKEDGDVMHVLFEYILRYREHYVDTLRHLSKELFKKILCIHLLSMSVSPSRSPLLKKMAYFLLKDLPQHSQGKYGLLSCIVDLVGTDAILQWYPSLPEDLYKGLNEVNLFSHISELLEILFRKPHNERDDGRFNEIWLKPLVKYLNSDSKEFAIAVNEHVLPKLHKERPESLGFLLGELMEMINQEKGNCFSVSMTCIKFYQRRSVHETVFDFMSIECLQKALTHADDQVRLSAFSMICESPKTTEVVLENAFKLIMELLPYNLNCQAPAFRQQLVSHLKKLLNRMVDSKNAFPRKKADSPELVDFFTSVENAYEEFLKWLKKYLYSCLFPGANFPRRVTVLNLLLLLHKYFPETLSFSGTLEETQTLLYALQDTYENNKQISLKILQSVDISILATEDEDCFKTLLETSLILASSTKPPDTVTAAYMFAFMVKSKNFDTVLLNHLLVSMENGPCLLQLEKDSLSIVSNSSAFIGLLLLSCELLKHLKIAQDSLCDAAACAPIYGVLACIRSIISEIDFKTLDDNFSVREWANLIRELISLGIQVAKVVEPVVSHASPEGHLPMDPDSDSISKLQATVRRSIGKRFQSAVVESEDFVPESDQVVLDKVKTHAVSAQILLLCCWRTHKEVSLLFGEISDRIPVSGDNDTESGILNVTQVKDIGDYFMDQMASVQHKGAFEQAYIGFTKLCKMLWRSPILELQELPQNWLNDLCLAIKGLKDDKNFSYTRRSAGLPFIMQAILASEPGISSSLFFKNTISSLLSMASTQKDNGNVDEMVHALNILRALFRDSCLSDVLIPFVSEALMASIIGFKSHYWIVRNSSHLLFSALMTRIFGVSGPQDEVGKKNRLTGRTFFSYYKEIYAFLYDELKQCAAVMNQNRESLTLVPSLYPILLVLGRLYPAPGECDSRLTSFIPFLNVCSGSPIWKVRVLAAQALVPLISAENFSSTLQSLFDYLPQNGQIITSHNQIHGICLQISNLLRECCHLPVDRRKVIEENIHSWIHSHSDLALNLILVPSLYPILLVLGRLYPAPGECDSRLTSFIPFLNVCSGSPIWKVRVLAAQALVPLISAENFSSTLQSLFDYLPQNGQIITGHNRIHGICLQISNLLRECCHLPVDRRKVIEENIHSWIHSHSDLALKVNTCFGTRVAYLEVILLGISLNSKLGYNLLLDMIKDVLSEIQSVASDPKIACMKEHYLCLSVVVIILCLPQIEQNRVDNLLKKIDPSCNSLPTLIQKFLETPYESVRCIILHCLVCLFQKDGDTYKNDLNNSVIPIFFSALIATSISTLKKEKQFIFNDLCTDHGFSAFLIKMLVTEENSSSCLGKVCHLLSLMLSAVDLKWDFDEPVICSCSCSKLEYVLELLQNCRRDEVSNLILVFASHLGVKIYHHLAQPMAAVDSGSCTRCLPILRRWCDTLEESAQPENCVSKRKAVVIAFKKIPQDLLLNKFKVTGGLALKLWQTLLSLITDDEPEIKHLAAEFISSIETSHPELERKILPAVPSFALEYTIKIFASEDVCPPSHRIAVLLNWMLSCKIQAVDCMGDEQPFDRGELNVYVEDLFLSRLSSVILRWYLQSFNWQDISSLRVCDWKVISDLKDPEFTIDEIVTICLDELKELLELLQSRKAISSLLDINFDLDILKISQRLYAVKCFAPSVTLSVNYRALELLEDIKKINFRSFFFGELLSSVQESLESSVP